MNWTDSSDGRYGRVCRGSFSRCCCGDWNLELQTLKPKHSRVFPIPRRSGRSHQFSARPALALVEASQEIRHEENQQYRAQPYPCTATIAPAAMAVVPSTTPKTNTKMIISINMWVSLLYGRCDFGHCRILKFRLWRRIDRICKVVRPS